MFTLQNTTFFPTILEHSRERSGLVTELHKFKKQQGYIHYKIYLNYLEEEEKIC